MWRRIILATLAVMAATLFVLATPRAQAQGILDVCKQSGAKKSAVCNQSGGNNLSGPNGIIIKVANIFAFVGGVGAMFVIMIGGFMMITASGDTSKAKSGRAAIIYATVGLVVIVLGRTVIGFVITKF